MKTAYAMPCTQEQWNNEMKPLCDKHGLKYENILDFKDYGYLVNTESSRCEQITNWANPNYKISRTLIPYNPALFLYSLGVFPEKWCVRGSEEFANLINNLASQKIITLPAFGWTGSASSELYFFINSDSTLEWCDTPTDYIEVTLEDLIKHYEGKQTTEQPKWEDRTRGGYEYKIIMENCGNNTYPIIVIAKIGDTWEHYSVTEKGQFLLNKISSKDLIPFNPLKAELLARKSELERELEEVCKELEK